MIAINFFQLIFHTELPIYEIQILLIIIIIIITIIIIIIIIIKELAI